MTHFQKGLDSKSTSSTSGHVAMDRHRQKWICDHPRVLRGLWAFERAIPAEEPLPSMWFWFVKWFVHKVVLLKQNSHAVEMRWQFNTIQHSHDLSFNLCYFRWPEPEKTPRLRTLLRVQERVSGEIHETIHSLEELVTESLDDCSMVEILMAGYCKLCIIVVLPKPDCVKMWSVNCTIEGGRDGAKTVAELRLSRDLHAHAEDPCSLGTGTGTTVDHHQAEAAGKSYSGSRKGKAMVDPCWASTLKCQVGLIPCLEETEEWLGIFADFLTKLLVLRVSITSFGCTLNWQLILWEITSWFAWHFQEDVFVKQALASMGDLGLRKCTLTSLESRIEIQINEALERIHRFQAGETTGDLGCLFLRFKFAIARLSLNWLRCFLPNRMVRDWIVSTSMSCKSNHYNA